MPLYIKDDLTAGLVAELAARRKISKQAAVRQAVEAALDSMNRSLTSAVPLRDRIRPLQARVLAAPTTGLAADKAFFDSLSDED